MSGIISPFHFLSVVLLLNLLGRNEHNVISLHDSSAEKATMAILQNLTIKIDKLYKARARRTIIAVL